MEKVNAHSHLSLINTHTSQSDGWIRCTGCGQEYREHVINSDGLCDLCEKRAAEDAEKRERRERELVALLSPKAHKFFTWERFQVTDGNRKAAEAVKAFAPDSQSLYLFGGCGVGKSHLASLTARAAYLSGLRGVIVSEPAEMCRAIQAAGRESPEAERAAIDRFVRAPVFVLDDLGTEKITDYRLQILYEVINGRDKAMQHGLVVTSNLSLGKLGQSLDDRIASRLGGMCRVIEIKGRDWRTVR